MITHYDTLEIPNNATPTEIKRAYYQAVKKFSPEHNPEKFEQIKTAYEILKNPQERLYYDSKIEMKQSVLFQYRKVKRLSADGKTGKAIKEYQALLEVQPDNLILMNELANAYEERGFFNKAIEQYEKILALNELNTHTWNEYIHCLLNHDFLKKAEKAIRKAVELNERHNLKNVDILVFAVLHFIYMRMDHAFARRCFDMLHKLDITESDFNNPIDQIINMVIMTRSSEYIDDALLIGKNIKPQDYNYENIERLLLAKDINALYNSGEFDDILTELFQLLDGGVYDPYAKFDLLCAEGYILFENPKEMRKQIRKISIEYPRLFTLHKSFFQNFLNEKNENKMCETNISKINKMLKKYPELRGEYLPDEQDDDQPDDQPYDQSNGQYYKCPSDGQDDEYDGYNEYNRLMPVKAEPKTGRNEPCPCGSGKKYKKCCGK